MTRLPPGTHVRLPDDKRGPGPSVQIVSESRRRDPDGFPHGAVLEAWGGWLGAQKVRLDVQVRDGAPTVISVTVTAPNGVTHDNLARVRIEPLLRAGLTLILRTVTHTGTGRPGTVQTTFGEPTTGPRRRQRVDDDERLRAFVVAWRQARKSSPGAVVAEVIQALARDGQPELSRRQVYRLRKAAHQRRWLKDDEIELRSPMTRLERAQQQAAEAAGRPTNRTRRTTTKGQGQ